MAVDTGYGVFSTGVDTSLIVADPLTGLPLRFGNLTDFDAKPQFDTIESYGIDGLSRTADMPKNHKLSFTVDRDSPNFERWVAAREESYFRGIPPKNITITQIIREPDGSISTYLYTGVAVKPTDFGAWSGAKKVTMKWEGTATRKRRLV
ncbi:hypothetical protein [Methylosinus sp. PW1]|uniref:hypothetical protein n=1 Tax=Methylosinus sp. PW1 TaxID=107636 RepID=UPI00068D975D|nr:hypothetical protein [Methylosinus sp. PW1]